MLIEEQKEIIDVDKIYEILKQREENAEGFYTFEEAYALWKKYISNLGKNV